MKQSREQVKWDFSNYGYDGFNGCPQCAASLSDSSFAVHPETVRLLCDKHYQAFREWHDSQVDKGYIKSWFPTKVSEEQKGQSE